MSTESNARIKEACIGSSFFCHFVVILGYIIMSCMHKNKVKHKITGRHVHAYRLIYIRGFFVYLFEP